MPSLVPKKLQHIQYIFLFLIGKIFRHRCNTKPQIWPINMPIQSPFNDKHFFQKNFSGCLKYLFQNIFNFTENQSQKYSETCIPCSLNQYWLQFGLVISGQQLRDIAFPDLEQHWTKEGRNSWYLSRTFWWKYGESQ